MRAAQELAGPDECPRRVVAVKNSRQPVAWGSHDVLLPGRAAAGHATPARHPSDL